MLKDVLAVIVPHVDSMRESLSVLALHDLPQSLFRLTLHRRSLRVLELQPVRRSAGTVARAEPLRDNAF
jgi:hypothetical protein